MGGLLIKCFMSLHSEVILYFFLNCLPDILFFGVSHGAFPSFTINYASSLWNNLETNNNDNIIL